MRHRDEPAQSLGVERRVFATPEKPERVVRLVEELDELDAVVAEPVKLLLVVDVGVPRLDAGVFAKVVGTLRGQVVGDQVLPHAAANGLSADADVLEPPAVVVGRVALQNGGRVGSDGGGRQAQFPDATTAGVSAP